MTVVAFVLSCVLLAVTYRLVSWRVMRSQPSPTTKEVSHP